MRTWVLLAVLLAVAAVMGYFGFVRPDPVRARQLRVGFLIALGLAGLPGFVLWKDYFAVDEIAAVIQPFPGVPRATYVSWTSGEDLYWIVRTPAPPPDVQRFYAQETHRPGWSLVDENAAMMVLEREGRRLTLLYETDKAKGDTIIVFALTRR